MFFRKILFALFLLSSCQTNPAKQEKTIRLNRIDEPESLDPRSAHMLRSVGISRMLFDGLMRVGEDHTLEKALADQISLDDTRRIYTFKLKKTLWTNGREVTSYDFAYSWKSSLTSSFSSPLVQNLFCIKGAKKAKEGKISLDSVAIHTPDKWTLQVELEKPTPYFLELLSLPIYAPICKKYVKKTPLWSKEAKSFVCNGPYFLKKWVHEQSIVLQKNEKYWDVREDQIDCISYCMVSPEKEWEMFEKGTLD